MKGKYHLVFTTIFFLALWGFFNVFLQKEYLNITQVLAAIPLSYFPDIDTNFKALGHRNVFTHSIILWCIIYIFNPHIIYLLITLSVGFHCLCDCHLLKKDKRRGFYTIKLIPIVKLFTTHYALHIIPILKCGKVEYKGLNGKWSTVWLLMNFVVGGGLFLSVVGIN